MNKIAEGDEYLDYHNETLERPAKPWSGSWGVFLRQSGEFWTLWSFHIEQVGEDG